MVGLTLSAKGGGGKTAILNIKSSDTELKNFTFQNNYKVPENKKTLCFSICFNLWFVGTHFFDYSRLACVDELPELRPPPALTSGPPPFKMKVMLL